MSGPYRFLEDLVRFCSQPDGLMYDPYDTDFDPYDAAHRLAVEIMRLRGAAEEAMRSGDFAVDPERRIYNYRMGLREIKIAGPQAPEPPPSGSVAPGSGEGADSSAHDAASAGAPPSPDTEDRCDQCGGPSASWLVDSDRFNAAVEVLGREPGSGMICPVCFIRAHEVASGMTCTWRLEPGTPFRWVE